MVISFDFHGQSVRTLTIDGKPWFVLADVCKVLEIANPGNIKARMSRANVNTVHLPDSIRRGNPNRTVVNKSGLYATILRSDKPKAQGNTAAGLFTVVSKKTGGYLAKTVRSYC